ncbi:MAG: molybdopterin oxidoreductase family protein [Acidimicrobiales bacterium]
MPLGLPMKTSMICGFCSVGCSLDVHVGADGQATKLTPTVDYPVNMGMACPKGWEALTPLAAADRATTPLLRHGRGADLEPVDWPTAIGAMVGRFKAVAAEHGPESLAFLSTGQMATEEMALLGSLAKFGMGMVHGDGNTRQCMATSVVAYKQAFGFDAPPYTYADLELSDTIVLIGANPCIAHPILWERICRNQHNPEIVVIDPRRTETAVAATQHYPLRPKSDLWLLYGLAHLLIAQGETDTEFVAANTTGFDDFARHVGAFTPDVVSAHTDLPPDALYLLASTIAEGERVSFWWTMGVNQSHEGVRTAQAIINLALLTGNIGRAGTGANSITGQCNAMGSRLFSNTTNLLGGHDFAHPAHRAKVAGILGIDQDRIPNQASWAYDQILDGIDQGRIRGLWVVATNSAHSWIDRKVLDRRLAALDFLVVQDMYSSTETAQVADLVLPAAGWGEKEGTFINSERRVGLIQRVARAPGTALSDFAIFKLVAEGWGVGEMFAAWDSPESAFAVLKELSAGQPADITGIDSYAMIDGLGGVQWPWSAAEATRAAAVVEAAGEVGPAGMTSAVGPVRERRLFEDGKFFHPDGRARFVFDMPRDPPEATSPAYPFILLTGRGSSSQWHTQTRTAKSPMLRSLYPEKPYVEVNPDDAAGLGITTNNWVTVTSPRASMRARAFVTPTVAAGQLFIPMHYVGTNALTFAAFDPHSRQPSYKYCAVHLHPAGSD